MNVRLAKMKELDKIVEIMDREKLNMKKSGINQWDRKYPTKSIYEEDINKGELYLVEVGGEIGGFGVINKKIDKKYDSINWTLKEKCYSMHRVIVNSELGKKGIGNFLFLHMEKLAKNEGIRTIHIDTYIENFKAQKLFLKLGYKRVEEFKLKEGMKNFIAFEKNLV